MSRCISSLLKKLFHDETKEYVLDFTVKLENVILVSTSTTSGAASNSDQANAATTGSPTDSGNQSLQQAYGVPDFAAQSDAQLYGPSTASPGSFSSQYPLSAGNVSTGGVTQTVDPGGNSGLAGAPAPGEVVWGP